MADEEKVKRTANVKAFAWLGVGILVVTGAIWAVSAHSSETPLDRALAAAPKQPGNTSEGTASSSPAPVRSWDLEPLDKEITALLTKHGARYRVPEGSSIPIMDSLAHKIPPSQFVNLLALYEAIEGSDHTTTEEALATLRAADIGKYYLIQGDVFRIQADRDYPEKGLHHFSMFGEVRLFGNHYVPVNIYCFSSQPIPPFNMAPILGKITDFWKGENKRGETIIIPVVQVIAVVRPSGCCSEPEDVFINQN